MSIELKALINVLSEIEEVLPEVRDLEIYRSAWQDFEELPMDKKHEELTNKGEATFLLKEFQALGIPSAEVVHLGGNLWGVAIHLKSDRIGLVSINGGNNLAISVWESELLYEEVDSTEISLETTELKQALKLAYYFVSYYNPIKL
jgi:hypothetical protein